MSIIKNIIGLIENKSGVNATNGGEIYRIWFDNDDSGRCYVGQTVQGSLERIKQHIADAQTNSGGCPLLDDATRHFGINAMRYEILESGITTHEELDEAEKFWIKKFNCQYPYGYNVKSGGQGKDSTYTPINNKKDAFTPSSFINQFVAPQKNTSPIVEAVLENLPMNDTAKTILRHII